MIPLKDTNKYPRALFLRNGTKSLQAKPELRGIRAFRGIVRACASPESFSMAKPVDKYKVQ